MLINEPSIVRSPLIRKFAVLLLFIVTPVPTFKLLQEKAEFPPGVADHEPEVETKERFPKVLPDIETDGVREEDP